MQVEPGLVLGDLIGGEVALASHRPHRRDDILVLRNLALLDYFPMFVVNMAVDLLDNCASELVRVLLLHGLVVIHDIAHHSCMKSYRIPHSVLKVKVVVVKLVRGHTGMELGLHGSIITLAVELPLSSRLLHAATGLADPPSGDDIC